MNMALPQGVADPVKDELQRLMDAVEFLKAEIKQREARVVADKKRMAELEGKAKEIADFLRANGAL